MLLEALDNGIDNSYVLGGVAEEDGGRATALFLVAAALGHFQPPATCSGMFTDALPVSNRVELRGRAMTALWRRISVAGLPALGRSKTVSPAHRGKRVAPTAGIGGRSLVDAQRPVANGNFRAADPGSRTNLVQCATRVRLDRAVRTPVVLSFSVNTGHDASIIKVNDRLVLHVLPISHLYYASLRSRIRGNTPQHHPPDASTPGPRVIDK